MASPSNSIAPVAERKISTSPESSVGLALLFLANEAVVAVLVTLAPQLVSSRLPSFGSDWLSNSRTVLQTLSA